MRMVELIWFMIMVASREPSLLKKIEIGTKERSLRIRLSFQL